MGDTALRDHLTSYSSSRDITHILDVDKTLSVPTSRYTEFWYQYLSKYQITEDVRLIEVFNSAVIPLHFHISIKFMAEIDEPPEFDDFLQALVYQIQQVLNQQYVIRDTNVLSVIIASYPEVVGDGGHIYDFSIKFPALTIDKTQLVNMVLPQIFHRLDVHGVRRSLSYDPSGAWKDIISFYSDQFPMFGTNGSHGVKSEFYDAYYNIDFTNLINRDIAASQISEIAELFDLNNFTPVRNAWFPATFITFLEGNLTEQFILPMIMSSLYIGKPLTSRDSEVLRSDTRMVHSREVEMVGDDDYSIACYLMDLIRPEQVKNESCWLDIGRALYNITVNREASSCDPNLGLEKWIRFSSQFGITESACRESYSTFESERNGITVKTIAWFAKKANPEGYSRWHQEWVKKAIKVVARDDDTSFVEAFYREYWLDYMVDYKGDKTFWYHFRGHGLRLSPQGQDIALTLMMKFHRKFEVFKAKLLTKSLSENDATQKKKIAVEIKELDSITTRIKSGGFQGVLMKMLRRRFYVEDFNRFKDSNPALLGMRNGVIEIVNGRAEFRDGKPEDYIIKCTHVVYRHYEEHDKYRRLLLDWFNKMYPDKELLHHNLKWWSALLYGRNVEKLSPMLSGEGDNAKTMFRKLLQAGFGDYFFSFESDVITRSRGSSSSASPNIAMAENCRVIAIDEPDVDEQIKNNVWKKIIGGDGISTRCLYDNGGEQVITYTPIVFCNKLPPVENPDKASKSRVLIIPHLSRWPRDGSAPESEEEQWRTLTFKPDKHFGSKIPYMAGPFMELLVQFYPIYMKEGLSTPKIVEEYTAKYWAENDPYYIFTQEVVVPVYLTNPDGTPVLDKEGRKIPDETKMVTLGEVYKRYTLWFRDFQPNRKYSLPTQPTVRYNLEQHWKTKLDAANCWYGIQLRKADIKFS